jgi:hypothetical protein
LKNLLKIEKLKKVERLTLNEYLGIYVCQVYWWADFFFVASYHSYLHGLMMNDERGTMNDEGPSKSPLEGEVDELGVRS